MDPAITAAPGLAFSAPAAGGITIAGLNGELDIACAPALREQLLGLLSPGSSRLVIDLSKVSHCDASGLAVLIGTGRRATLLGGFLHLAAVSPPAWPGAVFIASDVLGDRALLTFTGDDPRDQTGQHASPGRPAARPKDGTAPPRGGQCADGRHGQRHRSTNPAGPPNPSAAPPPLTSSAPARPSWISGKAGSGGPQTAPRPAGPVPFPGPPNP